MNILIIGEFSAFAKHLKVGFCNKGHNVIVIQDGDGFKNIPCDKNDILYKRPEFIKFFGKNIPLTNRLYFKATNRFIRQQLKELDTQFDLIVVICDMFVSVDNSSVGVPLNYITTQVQGGAKLVLTTCGSDIAYQQYRKYNKYYEQSTEKTLKNFYREHPSKKLIERLKSLIQLSTAIVATAYDYYNTMCKFCDVNNISNYNLKYIQLPISLTSCQSNACTDRKVVIFHGVTRPIYKGTPYVVKALEMICQNYPDLVDVVVRGNMPYEEYCKIFNKIDILIDQTNGYGMGINANIGLMNGKVVLSNNEPEEKKLRKNDCPVINICPDSSQIYNVVEGLILDKTNIERIKTASRQYAVNYLESTIIVQKYLDLIV